MPDSERHQGPWVDGYSLSTYPGAILSDGVDVDRAGAHVQRTGHGDCRGPAPSLAQAVSEAPDIAAKCNLYGMFGGFYKGYDGSDTVSAEYNVANNPTAFKTVMAAPWNSVTLTPLDTCGMFELSGEHYASIWNYGGPGP